MRFEDIGASDVERLVDWIPKYTWPYHAQPQVDEDWVRKRAAAGGFFGPDVKSFWVIAADDAPVAMIRVFDLADITPLVDLRVVEQARGQGVGTVALHWLTRFVFETFAEVQRLGGYTRHDNVLMHRVFRKCGFVQEAYHRKSWRVEDGSLADSVGFAILRSDWLSGTTTPLPWSPS
jgi:RimJ/RimL family protein N-acetyltransferase